MDFSTIVPIILLIAVFVLLFLLGNTNKNSAEKPENLKEPEQELTTRFLMGQYIEGLPGQNAPLPLVYCGITEDDLVFCMGTKGREIGRISRNSLTNINISKREDAHQPWTIKKQHYCCLEINWSDFDTAKQKAIFRFAEKKGSEALANETAQTLRKWKKTT